MELAFKVKTTAPKKYCVKPNTGFVAPGATQVVHVIMQAQRDWPADLNGCKDKFLVQSVPSGGAVDFAELFAKGNEGVTETKLRVTYQQPAPPPSPVPEGEEDSKTEDTTASFKTSALPGDVPSLQRELERYRVKNESLSADLNASLRTKTGTGGGRGASRCCTCSSRVRRVNLTNDFLFLVFSYQVLIPDPQIFLLSHLVLRHRLGVR